MLIYSDFHYKKTHPDENKKTPRTFLKTFEMFFKNVRGVF